MPGRAWHWAAWVFGDAATIQLLPLPGRAVFPACLDADRNCPHTIDAQDAETKAETGAEAGVACPCHRVSRFRVRSATSAWVLGVAQLSSCSSLFSKLPLHVGVRPCAHGSSLDLCLHLFDPPLPRKPHARATTPGPKFGSFTQQTFTVACAVPQGLLLKMGYALGTALRRGTPNLWSGGMESKPRIK